MKTVVEENEPSPKAVQSSKPTGQSFSSARALQIRTILVPMDFSRASMQALKYTISLAKEFEATIHLVHVQPTDELTAIENAGGLMLSCVDSIALMQDRLSESPENNDRFLPNNCHVVSGLPFEEICKSAVKIKADLIVLPTRGLGGLQHMVMGSTAERVVRYAPCPVLVPRGPRFKALTWNSEAGGFKLRKILVPVDFSSCSLVGLEYAAGLAKDTGATLSLFHVVYPYTQVFGFDRMGADMTPVIENVNTTARAAMDELLKLSFLRDLPSETTIQTGPVIDSIVSESSRSEIDLVAISTHGRTGFKHALMGSIAEHVVRYAECPVVVVPSKECNFSLNSAATP